VAQHAGRVITLEDGRIIDDRRNAAAEPAGERTP
jgi:hypothetical protein